MLKRNLLVRAHRNDQGTVDDVRNKLFNSHTVEEVSCMEFHAYTKAYRV